MTNMKNAIEHLIAETKRHGSSETPWGAIRDLIPSSSGPTDAEKWRAAQTYFAEAGLQSSIIRTETSDMVLLRPIGR